MVRDATLYLAAEMTLEQRDGSSVFDYSVASYVRDSRASISLGYCHAVSAPALEGSDTRLLVNPGMVVINGQVPGWLIVGGSRPAGAKLVPGNKAGRLQISLPPMKRHVSQFCVGRAV